MRRWMIGALLALTGCDDGSSGGALPVDAADMRASEPDMQVSEADAQAPAADLNMTAADFDCMLDWPAVRRFRITNKLGQLDAALAVANNPAGGVYPAGTVIQLIPQEAMVKRATGWNPATNDWEFFFLNIDREGAVTIENRGTEDTENAFGGNCFECHAKAQPQWDLVCEQDHGCDPLPFSAEVIRGIQEADARCP
jgi:hypothetical protein